VEDLEGVLTEDEIAQLVRETPGAWYLESNWPGPDVEGK